ncbi:Uncharacterised protein [Mycobacteroides abscessus subsp. abscessus]|uniref:Uncharacterized protein n=1 Tax=Mycobacteroides abscessus subsp. massiliense TaxID=1962118 RepID=A0A1U0U5M2_9MYCO|nr:hypothetical protein [Mycobacteroides abscessus]SHP42576.1 Uncharacterised protein [Mycobacteroides abscessus subsp. abscessus]SHS17919.1 Uncharacterised protein [Mycobacteroides abscessus subsp. abscessus]SHX74553.1 Uncharacterised protein [Mycobacteroides abscessus subsp. abscessus]SIF45362.1 Uncharacterised protein [Mycobacteroides abscessus subsp. abscessus]SIF89682.1 Uncharacterised protein [Mycobacteroides abscessus subsp. abscessus]
MNDPAIEAAQRAWAGMFPLGPSWSAVTHDGNQDFFVATAREMARPIRELVEKAEAFGDELDMEDLKKLIYPPHELRSRTNA